MRLCRFGDGRVGLVRDAFVYDVTDAIDLAPEPPLAASRGDALIASLSRLGPRLEAACATAPRLDLAAVRLLAPVARPTRVIAARTNYGREARGDGPDLFLKAAASVTGPGEGVELRFPARRTDHEVELVAVVGRECDAVGPEAALGCIAGYCVGIDVTLRGEEDRGLRKSLDGFTVLGPWLTTSDECGEPGGRRIALSVNGERRQEGTTSDMVHGVAGLVAAASRWFVLRPGDVIMTGTPAGVGPVVPGDLIACSIEGLGSMRVEVRGPSPPAHAAQR